MPLSSIDFYLKGLENDSTDDHPNRIFLSEIRYVASLYHHSLAGYKPPKTSKINIELVQMDELYPPFYFGSILSTSLIFDRKAYLKLKGIEKYKFTLAVLHRHLLELAQTYSWQIEKFKEAKIQVEEGNFVFIKTLPKQFSKDKKKTAQIIISTTENNISLTVQISSENEKLDILMLKRSPMYAPYIDRAAKHMKWMDENTFGVYSEYTETGAYFNILNKTLTNNLKLDLWE